MSLTDQLQSAITLASSMEQQLATQSTQLTRLTQQVQTLTLANATLQSELSVLQPPPSGNVPASLNAVAWGFVANDTDPAAAVQAGITRMKSDGGTSIRLWHSHFGAFSTNTLAAINAAAAHGVSVIICLQPKDGGTFNLGTPDVAGFVSKNRTALAKVQFVEVGNELNLTQYLPDDMGGVGAWHKPYVDRWLAPLRALLTPLKVKLLCTSITDTNHPDTYAQQYDLLHAAGAADQCDGVAIHLYFLPQYLQELSTIIGHVKNTWSKPLYVTECNIQTQGLTPAQWQAQFPPYMTALRNAGVTAINFYRGFPKTTGGWMWPTLFDATGQVTDVYSQFLSTVK